MATMAETGIIPTTFPASGLDHSQAVHVQLPREVTKDIYARSTPEAVNVRTFDVLKDRRRGGRRAGSSRLGNRVHPKERFIIQHLGSILTDEDEMQTSLSGRQFNIIAVSEGKLYSIRPGEQSWLPSINATGNSPPLLASGVMQSAANIQLLFFADGINEVYYNPRNNTLYPWVLTQGLFPKDEDENRPRLICTWRGRTVLSGLLKDPQSIFASRMDDPFDFDYAPLEFDAGQAWALTTGQQGVVGDKVTGLCPWTDDILLVFGETSLQMIQGDVTAGGRRSFITDQIGGAWGKCWCIDPQGNVFFVSNKMGIHVFRPGQQPVEISEPVKQLLDSYNTGTTNMICGYDPPTRSIHFFLTPIDKEAPARHLTLELRTMSWTELVFANNDHNPACCATLDGNEPGDRRLHFGSWDGFVRRFDPDAEDDDGTPIESSVVIGPIVSPSFSEVRLDELVMDLAVESEEVDYEVLAGRTADEALASEPVASGTFSPGRSNAQPIRVSSSAVYVRLKSQNKWAMERLRFRMTEKFPTTGRRR